MDTLIAGIIAGLALAAALLFYFLRKRPKAAQAFEEAVQPTQSGPEAEEREQMEGLVSLNIQVREAGLEPALHEPFESIIDRLRTMLPETAARFPGEELTWEIKRIATHHLPDLLARYLALSGAGRDGERGRLQDTLGTLKSELEEIEELVAGDQVKDFSLRAATIRRKFE